MSGREGISFLLTVCQKNLSLDTIVYNIKKIDRR